MSLELKGVSKFFGARSVLRSVSALFTPRVLITGVNGSGKTTLLRLIAGLSRPDSGEILLNGAAVKVGSISLVSGESFLYPSLTVEENLRLYLKSIPLELLAKFNLQDSLGRRLEVLSTGQKTKVAVVKALSQNSKILLFDEPLNSLDEDGRAVFCEQLECYPGEVIVTSHDIGVFADYSKYRLVEGVLQC